METLSMTPTRPTQRAYQVQVTLTATVDAQDSASAGAAVLHDLRLDHPGCELVVVQVTEVTP
jgi:hypothetical protein